MTTPAILRAVLATSVVAGLNAYSSNPVDAGGNNHRIERAVKQRQQQIDKIQFQLREKHGDDAWFVFRVIGIKPNVSQSMTRVTDGRRYRDYGSTTLHLQTESKTYKVKGPEAAAEMIWQSMNTPLHYTYRAFKLERDADDFCKNLIR